MQQKNRSFDATDQNRRGAHRTWFESRIDRGTFDKKISLLQSVTVKQLRSIIILDCRRGAARSFCPKAGNGRSQCPLFAVLDRTLVSMDLVLLKRQNLTVRIVDDEGVDVQTVEMRRLRLIADWGADRRVEAQVQGREQTKESKGITFCTKKCVVCRRFHSSLFH
ncbi:MAG: hypothetical protein WAV38_18185 [Xanthobacteraceae bacterium]